MRRRDEEEMTLKILLLSSWIRDDADADTRLESIVMNWHSISSGSAGDARYSEEGEKYYVFSNPSK